MKLQLLSSMLFLCSLACTAQEPNIDSFLAHPSIIELSISNPQPRLNESFTISYDPGYLTAQIFREAFGKLQDADNGSESGCDGEIKMPVRSTKLGKDTLGPFHFTINGVACRTTQIVYEVIPALPPVDEGIWIRHCKLNDTLFCIITEQRMPVNQKIEKISPEHTRIWNEPASDKSVKVNYKIRADGVLFHTGRSNEADNTIYLENDKDISFHYVFSIAYFEITDKKARITVTKDWFENLPPGYKLETIIVQ